MSAAATATTERSTDPNAFLPTFPGEDSLAHEGTQFMEDAKAALSAKWHASSSRDTTGAP
jgi:hypothetical protein